jgi:hypothetical protein
LCAVCCVGGRQGGVRAEGRMVGEDEFCVVLYYYYIGPVCPFSFREYKTCI